MNDGFVIWGIPAGGKHEALLVSEYAGLRDRDHAERVAERLVNEYGCRAVRVQKLEPLESLDVAGMWR